MVCASRIVTRRRHQAAIAALQGRLRLDAPRRAHNLEAPAPRKNRKVLLDHLFIISAEEITRAARAGQRRHILFMDRDEFLNHAARILMDLRVGETPADLDEDDIPF
jgi:hypothetical protein